MIYCNNFGYVIVKYRLNKIAEFAQLSIAQLNFSVFCIELIKTTLNFTSTLKTNKIKTKGNKTSVCVQSLEEKKHDTVSQLLPPGQSLKLYDGEETSLKYAYVNALIVPVGNIFNLCYVI